MEASTDHIDKTTYDICTLIHNLVKLDVEFLDDRQQGSYQLFYSKMPFTVQPSRSQTIQFMDSFLRDKHPKDFLYHTDKFQLSYLGLGLWDAITYKGTIIVGPFLSEAPNDSLISGIMERNNLPLGHRYLITQYYKTLSVIDPYTYKSIGHVLVNLLINPSINANLLIQENENFIINTKEKNEIEKQKFYTEIELRYTLQNKLRNAVRNGSKEEAIKLYNLFNFNPTHRVPNNPLRARKNLNYSFSAGLRNAAEEGGVSPVYLHNTSDKYASLIEKVSSISELETLVIRMISEFCDLVKKQSSKGYSKKISSAIDYINLNFDSSLSLSQISDRISINSSHLSRQFKKETNMTITEFINKRRIEEAKFLIEKSNNSITEIAMMVGFESHNYFYAVFKQITSLTPKGYLNKIRGKL